MALMFKKRRIYLDTAAATPLDPAVRRAMQPFWVKNFANPSSLHEEGVAAAKALAAARTRLAEFLAAHPDEIIFTSGATEANNLAIFGFSGGVLSLEFGHASVLAPLAEARRQGRKVVLLPVGESGVVDPTEVKKALTPDLKLITLVYADSELGVIQPVREIAKVIRDFRKQHQTPFPYLHLDACQAARFLDLNVARLGVDLMTLNGAKSYGPKGVGCLYVRRGVPLESRSFGGGQEAGRRAGTENVASIVGLAEALSLCAKRREKESSRLSLLRDKLISGLLAIPGAKLNGHATERLPNNVNVTFSDFEAEQIVLELDAKGIAASAGSACAANKLDEHATMGVRFSLDRKTTAREVNEVCRVTRAIINKLQQAKQYASGSHSQI